MLTSELMPLPTWVIAKLLLPKDELGAVAEAAYALLDKATIDTPTSERRVNFFIENAPRLCGGEI